MKNLLLLFFFFCCRVVTAQETINSSLENAIQKATAQIADILITFP
jgi:hypothetical protein